MLPHLAAPGYDPGFLTARVPLPTPTDARATRTLTYPRFTVLLDPARRLAVMTGVNIDGALLRDVPRSGDWDLDPRVAADEQAGPALYARNDLDRGHLVRRRDPGWGGAAEARAATEATFVYPNAAPQVNVFNQSKDLWLGLEDHVLEYADATDQRVSVFTAPVLADDDPEYRGIRVPRRFVKIAAWAGEAAAGPALRAAGFVLDQSSLLDRVLGMPRAADLGAYRTFQAPIDEIAALAGLDVEPLAAADVLAPTAVRGGDAWRPLHAPEEIVLG
ncbi:DNA/RNA non-specific endonuclease [Microbacterium hominis]|uniref:DNA/RNA non-specific endonuclease n=1 Tax=Microbacterium hominis TaxID=162426 RepID=UPI0020B6A4A2|nr:DNA/RNA non-specific endonuclease [Microbacterium hominis]